MAEEERPPSWEDTFAPDASLQREGDDPRPDSDDDAEDLEREAEVENAEPSA